jgi:deoxyribodipyrimidine photo-lyase
VCFYLNCPAELSWHGTSAARVGFVNETLKLMQSELKKLRIPLVFLEVEKREDMVPTVVKYLKENSISHVLMNYEYEVDELRRDIKVVKQAHSAFHVSIRQWWNQERC